MANNNQSPKQIIKAYLDERAAADEQFAANYAKEKKSLDECWKYIMGEARSRAVGGSCCMSDAEVFGLAVHYYDEDDIQIRPASPAKVKTAAARAVDKSAPQTKRKPAKKAKKPEAKKTVKTAVKHQEPAPKRRFEQMSLFNFD